MVDVSLHYIPEIKPIFNRKMTGFARLIVVFGFFYRLAFSMDTISHGKTNDAMYSSNDSPHLDLVKFQWFNQKLDHSNNNNTWEQRYFKIDEALTEEEKKKSAVFFKIGGQRNIESEDITKEIWYKWCLQLKAICVKVEHRFYGESHPTNNTSTENLRKYLNVDQAIADFKNFIEVMQDKWQLTKKNKWILFGGEYAGTLASILKLKYPELVYGVVASSAYFPSSFFQPEYFELVVQGVKQYGPRKCHEKIHMTFGILADWINNCLDDPTISDYIGTIFGLHPEFDCTNNLHISLLFQELSLKIAPIAVYQRKLTNFCNTLNLNKYKEIEDLASGLKSIYPNGLFINTDYERRVEDLRETSWDIFTSDNRQMYYQKCTELGGFPVPESDFMFRFNQEFVFKFYCTDPFDLDYEETQWDTVYHFQDYQKSHYKKTVFTVGKSDLNSGSQMSPNNKKNNRVIEISGASSSEDMEAYTSSQEPHSSILKAQRKIKSIIKEWIK